MRRWSRPSCNGTSAVLLRLRLPPLSSLLPSLILTLTSPLLYPSSQVDRGGGDDGIVRDEEQAKALAKLQQYAQMQARALDIPIDQLLVARPFTEAHQGAAVWEIEPPTIDEDDDSRGLEDDEAGGPSGDMPYTRSELQARARAKVAKDRGGVGGKLAHE